MEKTSLKLKVYISFILLLGICSVILGFGYLTRENITTLLFFTVLGIIAESVAIRMSNGIAISVSLGVGLSAVLIFQSPVVCIISFFSMLLFFESVDGKVIHIFNSSIIKRLFSGSAFAISLFFANVGYDISTKLFWKFQFQGYNIIGILMIILIFSILDTGIFLTLISLIENKTIHNVVNEETWLALLVDFIAITPLGVIIAVIFSNYGMFAVALFFGPLLLARYSFKLYIDMKRMYSETIVALSNAIDAKDQYTCGHSHRVADYAVEIAKHMGLNETQIDKIRTAAILHDIGKIGIDDIILNKPGKLEEVEYVEIKKHPEIGANILMQVANLSEVAMIIKHHHERYDGLGYPEGIGEDLVPIESYIISVSDAFDAMTSDRPYRAAIDNDVAIRIIISESGKQFKPEVVKALLQYIDYKEEHLVYAS
jgi:putative nucleotidyltransferase with HDIG domain